MRISIFTLVVVAFTLSVVNCDEGKTPAALSPVVSSDLIASPSEKTAMKPSRVHRPVRPKSDRIKTTEMKIRRGPKKDGIKINPKTRGKLNSSPPSYPARKPVEIAKQSPKDDGHIYRYIRQAKPSKTKKAKESIKKTLSSAAKKTKKTASKAISKTKKTINKKKKEKKEKSRRSRQINHPFFEHSLTANVTSPALPRDVAHANLTTANTTDAHPLFPIVIPVTDADVQQSNNTATVDPLISQSPITDPSAVSNSVTDPVTESPELECGEDEFICGTDCYHTIKHGGHRLRFNCVDGGIDESNYVVNLNLVYPVDKIDSLFQLNGVMINFEEPTAEEEEETVADEDD